MAKYRMLWVLPQERVLKCGEVYDEADIRAAGYEPAGLVEAGEAELASPAEAAPKKKGK